MRLMLTVAMSVQASMGLATSTEFKTETWIKSDIQMTHLRRNRDMTYIAFVPSGNQGVQILEVKTGLVYEATKLFTGGSFFWSPDNSRLFFRELLNHQSGVTTVIKAWDASLKKSVPVDQFSGSSGLLSFDPKDQRMTIMHDKGIMSKRLVFPDERLAFWQSSQRSDKGKFVASQGGMTFLTQHGFAMAKLKDDDTGIDSFDLSPRGDIMVWATRYGRIYASKLGDQPQFIDFGREPQWHPEKELFVYAGARMVGNKAASYDIKISNLNSRGSFLTSTQAQDERWPIWSPKGDSVIFTVTGTTSLQKLKFGGQQTP